MKKELRPEVELTEDELDTAVSAVLTVLPKCGE